MPTLAELKAQLEGKQAQQKEINDLKTSIASLEKEQEDAKLAATSVATNAIHGAIANAIKSTDVVKAFNLIAEHYGNERSLVVTFPVVEPAGFLLAPLGKKAKASGDTNGRSGKTKDKYGMSLGEIFSTHASGEERVKHDSATDGNAKYAIKQAVLVRAEQEGKITAK